MRTNLSVIITFLLISALFKSINAQTSSENLDNKILIVVHMQEEKDKIELYKESTADEVMKMNQIIEITNPENVLYAKIVHKVLNLTWKKIYVDRIENDIENRIKMVSQHVFKNENGDIFSSEELKNYIQEKKVKQIVIVGREAEGCITSSVLSGRKLGYEMFIIPEAILGKSAESKLKAISKLKKKGVKELTVN